MIRQLTREIEAAKVEIIWRARPHESGLVQRHSRGLRWAVLRRGRFSVT